MHIIMSVQGKNPTNQRNVFITDQLHMVPVDAIFSYTKIKETITSLI